MNAPVLEKALQQRLAIVDCDIHPIHKSPASLRPYLSARWQEHARTFGQPRPPRSHRPADPSAHEAAGQRVDAYPADGGPPGSDLALMRKQHLDRNGVEVGMLVALSARRHGRAEPGLRRGAVPRGQRVADRGVGQAGTATARRHRRSAGRCGDRGGRDRGARRQHRVPPDHHLAAHLRAARTPALLADLRGRRALPGFRSGCIRPAPAAVTLRPDPAGRPTTCRSTIRSRPACRGCWRAWCSKACSSAFPTCGSA